MICEKDTAVVSLIPMDRELMKNITAIALKGKITDEKLGTLPETPPSKRLIYVMPAAWHVPELAMEENTGHEHHRFNPTNHGNPRVTDKDSYKVLISQALVDEGGYVLTADVSRMFWSDVDTPQDFDETEELLEIGILEVPVRGGEPQYPHGEPGVEAGED